MLAVYKARYRESKLAARNASDISPLCGFSVSLWRDVSKGRNRSVNDLGSGQIQNTAGLPFKLRRKYEKFTSDDSRLTSAGSSACNTPSSAIAAEVVATSPDMLHEAFVKAAVTQCSKQLDLGSKLLYPNALATVDKANEHITISEPPTHSVTVPENVLRLQGVATTTLTSISISAAYSDTSRATEDRVPLSPLDSSSSSVPTSISASSVSSEHSSYSATHHLNDETGYKFDAPRRGTKRKLSSEESDIAIRSVSTSVRPLAPAHLEYDYTVAHNAYRTAVAIAAHEIFGFSMPVRNHEMEARRPGKDAIPLLKKHPLVRRTARALDEADRTLERALARGETFKNTPIPDEYRWGSEYLRPYEWARLEVEPTTQKRIRRAARSAVEEPESGVPRTRSQKRRAGAGATNETGDEKSDGESDTFENSGMESSSASTTPPSMASASRAKMHDESNLVAALSSAPATSVTPPVPEVLLSKTRKRGRPRKHPIDVSRTSASASVSSHITRKMPDAAPAASTPIVAKRKRGRPRKHPLPLPAASARD